MSKPTTHPGIVVGVDGSPASKVAVQWAARDAELRSVPLTLVHVLTATAGTWLGAPLPPVGRKDSENGGVKSSTRRSRSLLKAANLPRRTSTAKLLRGVLFPLWSPCPRRRSWSWWVDAATAHCGAVHWAR